MIGSQSAGSVTPGAATTQVSWLWGAGGCFWTGPEVGSFCPDFAEDVDTCDMH